VWKAAIWVTALLQMAQNPSPMTEDTRAHERLIQRSVPGARKGRVLQVGNPRSHSPVILHFNGAPWLAEQEAASVYRDVSIAALYLGAGSTVYETPFLEKASFDRLLAEAEAGGRPLILTGFSAGYGAIRAILRHSFDRVNSILLMDGLHSAYDSERRPQTQDLEPFLAFAREAAAGKKAMLITHSEVYPGTFASTTETASWLIAQLSLKRRPILRWGPLGMQQISETRRGGLAILGFAGNSGPDHTDHYHAYGTWLRMLRKQ
jgi:hypothetical protein